MELPPKRKEEEGAGKSLLITMKGLPNFFAVAPPGRKIPKEGKRAKSRTPEGTRARQLFLRLTNFQFCSLPCVVFPPPPLPQENTRPQIFPLFPFPLRPFSLMASLHIFLLLHASRIILSPVNEGGEGERREGPFSTSQFLTFGPISSVHLLPPLSLGCHRFPWRGTRRASY